MKFQIIFCALVLLLKFEGCDHNNNVKVDKKQKPSNSHIQKNDYSNKNYPIYSIAECFEELLNELVTVNSNNYDLKKYFYSLSFKVENNRKYIVIEAVKYKACETNDFVGAIKISNAIFLCRGDINIDTLFRKAINSYITIKLENTEKEKENELKFDIEPTLRGLYKECKDNNIYLEVYTIGSLPEYKMQKQKK